MAEDDQLTRKYRHGDFGLAIESGSVSILTALIEDTSCTLAVDIGSRKKKGGGRRDAGGGGSEKGR